MSPAALQTEYCHISTELVDSGKFSRADCLSRIDIFSSLIELIFSPTRYLFAQAATDPETDPEPDPEKDLKRWILRQMPEADPEADPRRIQRQTYRQTQTIASDHVNELSIRVRNSA